MIVRLTVAILLSATAAVAATNPGDGDRDGRARRAAERAALITEYGTNADLPPNLWSCGSPGVQGCKKGEACAAEPTPLQRASTLKCLTEWLWSVQRYFAAGGKGRKGLEPESIQREKTRAAALAADLEKWAGAVPEGPAPATPPR